MRILKECFDHNRAWAAAQTARDPGFFDKLQGAQRPDLLWIGCSDSRLPPNEIIGRLPGEVFVHRNVANVVVHTDVNCLSVLQFAVDVLQVKHVVVCGHYGCGGVRAALEHRPLGLIDNWLRHIKDIGAKYRDELIAIDDRTARADRLCELNVRQQVANVCHTTIVQDAWRRGQPLSVHGWIFSLADGLLRDLGLCVEAPEQLPALYRMDAI
ncbi:MAG: carbonate dehydratase [Kofleriaceae bacterium]|nr:carbonate dehydratase [Myxococcales bacterium]MCB9561517.1 carbonate dehydratase [Kofleriaceae bacterium]